MKTNFGFSLLELTIVLIIVGLLLGGLMIPLTTRIQLQLTEHTKETLAEIKEALLGFAILHERLPCPAQDINGTAIIATNRTDCKKEGFLPWADLGVGRYDGWANPFRYRVEDEYSKETMKFSDVVVDADETTGSGLWVRKKIKYSTEADNEFEWLTRRTNDSRIAAIVFSCGENGLPDPTPNSIPDNIDYTYTNDADGIRNDKSICENPISGAQNRYVYDHFIQNKFDDIIIWLPRNILVNRLIISKQWPPEQWN